MKNLLNFSVYGTGQPLVMIPGFALKANNWGYQYRALKKHFKVITVEITGIGETAEQKETDYNLGDVVDDLTAVIESCGVSKTAIMGLSMGAMIALEFARKYPEKVMSLIAVSLPVVYSTTFNYISEMMNSSTDNDLSLKQFIPSFFSPAFVNHERFKIFTDLFVLNGSTLSKEVLSSQLGMIREWIESKSWVKGCQCPSLFVYGSEDQLVSKDEALNHLAPVFNNSEFKVVDGAGHSVHIEKNGEFNDIVFEFLKRQNW